jgi:HSP20 family protein
MRLGINSGQSEFDQIVSRMFGDVPQPTAWTHGYNVPTDVFHVDNNLVIRMELPGISPDNVEVTMQENTLLINGSRQFPYDAEQVRFVRRGSFYGDFTQKVALGKGLDLDKINARYDNGVLELTIPYAEEVQPKKILIDTSSSNSLNS